MPLWQAATLAYREVLATRPRRERAPSNDELDLVALVLSGYLPIYAAEPGPIAAEELDQGMFWGGARRFEWEPTYVLRGLRKLHLEFTPAGPR